ncbi:retron Ec78 anti-phage system effector ATPase PtuA [Klebsiella pneumoniae]|uniref:retron Ec78 anti-phage system effector ATPase PtuA n=1 Tax=Klebsiella pneumoniae TaxID=573 RepID=UPI0020104B1A|nr:retron Ec78 anti-phage system effector ATPase PtuA [Klebsiella pneumoniae]MCL0227805.1 AAA family ATPase [Klebsiella pneumoniae]MCL1456573.1 AAA family ATPase [Klebsiella pneumoniae]
MKIQPATGSFARNLIYSTKPFETCRDYIQDGHVDESGTFRPDNAFYLRRLTLKDFRRFSLLEIKFEEDLTVIIGNNGKGKTSILYAIAKTLSWFVANILKEGGSGQRLSELTDIKNDAENRYADVSSTFFFGKGLKSVPIRLSRSALGTAERRDSEVKPARDLADIWRVINEAKTINLPTFALYNVERSQPFNRNTKDNAGRREERFDAYSQALGGAGRFDHFVEWYIYLHKRTISDITSSIKELEQQVNDLQRSVDGGMVSVKSLLEQMKLKLSEASERNDAAVSSKMITESVQKSVVEKSICSVVPSISKIWVEMTTGSDLVKVTNDGHDVTIDQLSDGQRVFLSLVADLARRMVMLNPLLENPLEGRGIVLIDEIELHLHPKWQQEVILNLRSAFPNIQFIITTHSPIVLSTIEKRCIREFDPNDDGNQSFLDSPDMQTKGSENAQILEQVMNVHPTPPGIAESHWLGDFELLLLDNSGELDNQSQELYDQIKTHFGIDSAELKKADSLIRINKMKNKINKIRAEKGK